MTVTPGVPSISIIPLEFDPDRIANVTYIYSESDFPAPSGGIITLENKAYNIVGAVSIANKLRFPSSGSCAIFSDVDGTDTLTYTGTGAMFDTPSSDGFAVLRSLTMSTNDTFFNISGTSAGFFAVFKCSFVSSTSMGSISGVGVIIKTTDIFDFGQGISLVGNSGATLSGNRIAFGRNLASTTLVSISGTHVDILISDNFFETAGSNETIFDIDSSSSTSGAVCAGNNFDLAAGGTIFDPTGTNQTDIDWKFAANSGLADSRSTGGMDLTGPETVAIASIGVPVIINDVSTSGTNIWSLLDVERFTFSTTLGRLTYIGKDDISIEVKAKFNIEKVGGGADEIGVLVAKNGVVQPSSLSVSKNSTVTEVTTFARFSMVTDDFIETAAQNSDATADVIVTNAVVSITLG